MQRVSASCLIILLQLPLRVLRQLLTQKIAARPIATRAEKGEMDVGAGAPAPREPANQQEWGECTIYAFTAVAQEQLEIKYNTALDELDTRAALTRFCEAFAGVWPHDVGEKVNALGEGLKIKAAAPRAELYQLHITGAKVTDFDQLCDDGAAKDGLGAFSVAVIRTRAAGHGLHSVAAHKVMHRPDGQRVVLAKNSWGSQNPRWEVTRANYNSHYTFDVEIEACWSSANRPTGKPAVTEAYRGILRENREDRDKEARRRRAVDDLERRAEAERRAREEAERKTEAERAARQDAESQLRLALAMIARLEEGIPPDPRPPARQFVFAGVDNSVRGMAETAAVVAETVRQAAAGLSLSDLKVIPVGT